MAEVKSKEYEFQYDYGLAVIGSSINAYTVKESIAELLANLQYLSNISDISIIGIGHIILKVYEDVSNELSKTLREKGLSEILVGGFCVIGKRIRVLRFFPKIEAHKVEYFFEEVLHEDGIRFWGSAKKISEEIYKENDKLKPLQIVKMAIQSGKDNAIGGPLQSGGFYDENFRISGVSDKVPSENGSTVVTKRYLRGFELDQSKVTEEYPYLFVSYGYQPVD